MIEENKKFTPAEAAIITESASRSERLINEKLKNVNWLMAGVVIVLFVAVITMLLMVGGFLLDAWHFNSAVYRDYSGKIDTLETIQKSNQLLFDSNKQNQEIIIEQQKQIKELLKSQK
ncbi:MAG: hypothetical protein Q8P01_01350 [bacterium]|nr:hypothetical protein [bacterium]